MARHANKLQKAKEDAALLAIRRLQPDLSPAIWVLALGECDWDPNRASDLMNAFKEAKSKQLSAIQNVISTYVCDLRLYLDPLHSKKYLIEVTRLEQVRN